MTYEQAVATAMMQALDALRGMRVVYAPYRVTRWDLATRAYAWRRLRVRAGLVP